MVRNGSFAAASANASLASDSVTPSISKMILPGWISDTKYSGLPLPLPMRTSAGLDEIGFFWDTRTQMRAPRLGRDGLVRKHANPDAAAALDMARHRPARGLELARGEADAGGGLEAEFAEGHLGAARGDAGV